MIEYLGAIFLVAGFVVIFKIFKLVDASTRVIEISRQAVADLRNVELDDDTKESVMQTHAKQLFGFFTLITVGGIAAVVIPIALIWCLDRLHFLSIDAVLSVALSWPFLVATTVLICFAFIVNRVR